ncbi:SMC protein, putative [Ixodes scapularis]|uniref:SMC protein, putative n=1 Tax=Ixodes scapularis TaxID=6945 RepID=B7PZ54_IXOSC|nr:SMC protein, putative [Ixodes scapularis]|eukprot:XP_002404778.1 SMC protein, putative [Ixodes scapularis]
MRKRHICLVLCLAQAVATGVLTPVYVSVISGLRRERKPQQLCSFDGRCETLVLPSKAARGRKAGVTWGLQVEAAVAGLHIQVGNLCQFLPQDRVADFVKMSRQELLEGTEKAVGTRDGHLLHARLIQLQVTTSEATQKSACRLTQLKKQVLLTFALSLSV